MTMRTPTLVLVAALSVPMAAWSGENLTPEVLLPGHEATDAAKPTMAYGTDIYLLAWQADRNEKADIVGMRLDQAGKPLDRKPFVISAAKDCQERPRMAFGCGVFLVIWHDLRNGKDWDVFAARVTPAGKVLDPEGIAVGQGERNQCEPGVCWDGKNFQVLWRGFQAEMGEIVTGPNRLPAGGYFIYGGRVSPEGKAIDGTGVFMAKPPRRNVWGANSMGMAAPVSLGNGTLLAGGRSTNDFCLWRIADGKTAGEPWLSSKKGWGYDDPAFATDGQTVLATWTTFRDGGGRSSGRDHSGMLLFGIDEKVEVDEPRSLSSGLSVVRGSGARVRHPAPAWDGKRYVVVWDVPRKGEESAYEALFLRSFASDGTPLNDDELVADDPASPTYWPAVASDGSGTAIIVYEKHPATGDVPISIGYRVLKRQ
jgi:hypothetical protein